MSSDDLDDNASVLVIILQCETRPCDANIAKLKWVFSDRYFIIQVCAVDLPTNISPIQGLTRSQYLENYYMRKALTYAAEGPYNSSKPQSLWSDIPVIIVKDSSITNIPSNGTNNIDKRVISGMKIRIKTALEKAQQADLFFLCKWNDECNKYTDIADDASLKWSRRPTATQAIMYTPKSRDYIRNSLSTSTTSLSELLNTNIADSTLLATVFVPNIIDFDINLATSNEDYNKLNECSQVQEITTNTKGTSSDTSPVLWIVIIIILVILLVWVLIQV